jgi:hypothetical protein
VAAGLTNGFDLQWWHEFRAAADGLAADFGPWVIGFAAPLSNLSALTGSPTASGASWIVVGAWFVLGTLLSGGILDRYARQRAVHAHGFGAACGRLAFRLLRLNVLVLLLGAALLWIGLLVGKPIWTWATHDLASERAAFLWAAGLSTVAALVAIALVAIADCARVRMVVEDRRSAVFALAAGLRFAWRHRTRLLALYALLGATQLVILGVYAIVAPGATLAGAWAWAGFAVSQVYIAARVVAKLLTYASATSLFQAALAHAEYVAQPAPVWPESPAVETLGEAGAREEEVGSRK